MPLSGIPRLRGLVRQGEELTPVVRGKPDGLNARGVSSGGHTRGKGAVAPGGPTDLDGGDAPQITVTYTADGGTASTVSFINIFDGGAANG